MRTLRNLLLAVTALFLTGSAVAQAAPQFDTGSQINLEDVYSSSMEVKDVLKDGGVLGKLTGAADVYKFVADQDGDQTLSLVGKGSSTAQPFLVLVDPTDATESKDLGIPLPGDGYHTALITPTEGLQTYYEPTLFEKFNLYAQQRVKLQKDKAYYLIVFDPAQQMRYYGIRFGDGKIWKASDFFTHFGSWVRFKTDSYAGTSPFHFSASTFGSILFFLALSLLVGIWIIEESFSFMANRSKMAGYILIKMQNFSRIFIWIALWFVGLGGYIYFDNSTWAGIPFLLGVIYFLIAAVFLTRTFGLSRKLMALEVSKQEATIPLALRKQHYIMFVLSLVTVGSFLLFLTMHVS
jgi:hypothetical protein